MRTPRSALVILLLLGFGLPLAVPAEDVPETPYDESEALPYERTPLFSIAVPQASPRIAKAGVSRDSPVFFHSWTKHSMSGRGENAQPVCVPASLAIRNHSLRC